MFNWFRKARPCFDDQWMDIKDFPIPENERAYIVTDGKVVHGKYSAEYNRNGNAIFWDGYNRIITHWMRYPKPPKRK